MLPKKYDISPKPDSETKNMGVKLFEPLLFYKHAFADANNGDGNTVMTGIVLYVDALIATFDRIFVRQTP